LQDKREQVMQDFRNKKLKILVATDILSRGIDIEEIELVINYDVPNDGEDYIHRIGRTVRAETKGTAITFISEAEQRKFAAIEQLLGKPVTKVPVPEEFGPAPEYAPKSGGRPGGRSGRPSGGGRNHSGQRNSGGRPSGNRPGANRHGGNRPGGNRQGDNRPSGNREQSA